MDDEIRTPEGISRRTMIRRAGVVGAVAWTAPAVYSLGSSAHAGSAPAGSCTGCGTTPNTFCSSQPTCGEGCHCSHHVGTASECICVVGTACNRQECPNGDADCPSGEVCMNTCCDAGGGVPQCFIPCGQGQALTAGQIRSARV